MLIQHSDSRLPDYRIHQYSFRGDIYFAHSKNLSGVAWLRIRDSEFFLKKRRCKMKKIMQCVAFLWNSLLWNRLDTNRMRLSSASGVLSFLPQSLGCCTSSMLGTYLGLPIENEMTEARERGNPKRFKACFNCSPRTLDPGCCPSSVWSHALFGGLDWEAGR